MDETFTASKYFVYVDWTTNTEESYPYYVGKGNSVRIGKKYRNDYHKKIAQKHGLRREVVFETSSEEEAFQQEMKFIKELNTFHQTNVKGANFTVGGDGAPGVKHVLSQETKDKIRASLKGKTQSAESNSKRSAKLKGRKPSMEHIKRIVTTRKANNSYASHQHTPEQRKKISTGLLGKKRIFSEEHKLNLSRAIIKQHELRSQRQLEDRLRLFIDEQ